MPAGQRRWRRRVVLLVLLGLTAGLAVVDLSDDDAAGSPVTRLRAVAVAVLGPAQEGADALGRAGRAGWAELIGDETSSSRLRRENAALAAEAAAAREAAARAGSLEGLATATDGVPVATGRVLGVRAEPGGAWTATLDVGSDDGVETSTTVLAAEGAVGRVRSVAASTCEVLLLPDPRSAVAVRVQRSGQLGTAEGTGDPGTLALTLLDPQAALAVGDALVTLGSDGGRPFVPGVAVGTVDSVDADPGSLTRTATLALAVDPTRLDVVAVVLP